MSNRSPELFLEDILASIDRIEGYVSELTYEEFCVDRKTVDAVIRNLEIIGEAAKNVPVDMRAKHPEIPWSEMARVRDKVIHGYFDIVFNIIWETVKVDLPQVKPDIEAIIGDL